jgi:hypothetical protein
MYVINMGKATLEKKGVTIKTFSCGGYFGSTVMLNVQKVYLGTLVVQQTCHVLGISRRSYIQALEHYPAPMVAANLKASETRVNEELRKAIERISARKFIWKRYQGMVNPDSQDSNDKSMTDSEMINRIFEGWFKAARKIKELRFVRERERSQYRMMMQGWVKKRREAWSTMKRKQAEEQTRLDAVCPFRQRAAEEKSLWEPARRGRRATRKLLALAPATPLSATSPDSAHLVELLKEWPTPRPSPFYNLRVWNVLADSLNSPGCGSPSPLLPLLTSPPSTAEANPCATAEPLCASPEACDDEGEDEDAASSTFSDEGAKELLSHSYVDDLAHLEGASKNLCGFLGSFMLMPSGEDDAEAKERERLMLELESPPPPEETQERRTSQPTGRRNFNKSKTLDSGTMSQAAAPPSGPRPSFSRSKTMGLQKLSEGVEAKPRKLSLGG